MLWSPPNTTLHCVTVYCDALHTIKNALCCCTVLPWCYQVLPSDTILVHCVSQSLQLYQENRHAAAAAVHWKKLCTDYHWKYTLTGVTNKLQKLNLIHLIHWVSQSLQLYQENRHAAATAAVHWEKAFHWLSLHWKYTLSGAGRTIDKVTNKQQKLKLTYLLGYWLSGENVYIYFLEGLARQFSNIHFTFRVCSAGFRNISLMFEPETSPFWGVWPFLAITGDCGIEFFLAPALFSILILVGGLIPSSFLST